MKNKDYWQKRFEQLEDATNKEATHLVQDVNDSFRKAQTQIENQIHSWYQRFATNNNITMVEARKILSVKNLAEFKWDVKDYIKYGEENALNQQWMKQLENASARYHISKLEALKLQTQQVIEVLYGNQLDDVDKLMKKVYTEGYYHTAYEIQKGFNIGYDISSIDENKLKKIVSKPWAVDGKNFSERIWGNKSKLINELHTELTQMVITGRSPDEAISNIAKKMNTSKNNSGRLVMTESAYFHSASQQDAFNELDVEQFENVATLDSSTSEICQQMDGQVFDMKDYEPGVTAPPFHVWCRTTTVPYFDDEFNLGERAARDEDGKTYYVPSNMTYPQWMQSFVDNVDKSGLKEVNPVDMMKGKKDEIQALKQSIMDKHDNILQTDVQKAELDSILSKHGSKELNLYDKLANQFSSNDYHYKRSGAAYYPSQKVVKMNINSHDWENRVGTGQTAAWHTKIHEEFHQLDHLLSQTKFALQSDGTISPYKNIYTHFTGQHTVIGQKMIQSIDDDILTVMNKAIDWFNENDNMIIQGFDKKVKHLNSLNRISREAYKAMMIYLKTTYNSPKLKAQIGIFTDAMGLTTKNRLNPHGNGFWGHDASYNKDRSKDGATSETWATFGSLVYSADDETISLVKELMPTTWATYTTTFQDILEYALENDIDYSN